VFGCAVDLSKKIGETRMQNVRLIACL